MAPSRLLLTAALAALPALLAGCFDEPPDRSDLVFVDALEPGVVYQPFRDSKPKPVVTDSTQKVAGFASLRFTVPSPGEADAGALGFSGGAFTSDLPRDLAGFTALTFWAKADRDVAFDSLGLGNDNTGGSLYQTEVIGLPLTPAWKRFVIPIPAPGKMTKERGLLWLSAGATGTPKTGYRAWFDEIQFEKLDTSTWDPRPTLTAATPSVGITETYQIAGTAVTYTIDGQEVVEAVYPATFDWASSNEAVATVDGHGLVAAVGPGTAVISASLGSSAVPQTVTVTGIPPAFPLTGAPVPPARAAADVISLYSDAYANVPVYRYAADWSNGCVSPICPRWSEEPLGGDPAFKYVDLAYTAIELKDPNLVDASLMTHVHVDVWTHASTFFKLKLYDFGANGVYDNQAGDDRFYELTFNATSAPILAKDQWVSLDIPLSAFIGLTTRAHLAQVVFSANNATIYVDNVYFHR